jgi:TetR/AcrR family transcriptional regulator
MKEKPFPRRDLVMEAALDEFTTNDYEKASLNNIIKSSGISKGVFYYHFKNKEALYLSLLKAGAEAKWQYINEQTRNNDIDFNKMDIFDKFIYQAELGLGFAALHPKYHALGRMFSKEKNNPIYQTAVNYIGSDSTDMIASMIKEAIAKYELNPEFDEAFIVKVISHLLLEFDQIFDEESDCGKDETLTNLKNYIKFIKYGFKA